MLNMIIIICPIALMRGRRTDGILQYKHSFLLKKDDTFQSSIIILNSYERYDGYFTLWLINYYHRLEEFIS